MSLLNRLFGKQPDPTENWVAVFPTLPDFDVGQMRFGALGFGDEVGEAEFLGKPDRAKWNREGNGELLYSSCGFLLEFEDGEFAYLAFFLGPDESLPDPAMAFSQPLLRGGAAEGTRLSGETERAAVERIFGAADEVDADPKETILTYTRAGVTMEFELNGETGRLKRWNLYPM